MIPAGVHWKVIPRNAIPPVDGRYWKFPIEPEQIRPLYRRARGQTLTNLPDGIEVKPERYERRLAALILGARYRLALAQLEAGQFAAASRLCQSIIDYDDDEFEKNPEIIHLLGIASYAAGDVARAETALRISAERSARKENRATALFYLGEIAEKRGAKQEARQYFERAFSIPGLDPAVLKKMQASRNPR
jgi:tetratricopeptide (TPR) repeat protein